MWERCGKKSFQLWFGGDGGVTDREASISTTLNGIGKAILSFGNCWKNGIVTVYKKVGAHSIAAMY